jgi:hypothetical protein
VASIGCVKVATKEEQVITKPESVADKVLELREVAEKMMRQDTPYCLEIHALAVDIIEGLNLKEEAL